MPPGGDAKIDVTVNTAGRSGKLLKTVSVFSNDPKKPIAQLHVAVDIEAPDGGPQPGRLSDLPPQVQSAPAASRPARTPLVRPGPHRAPPAQPGQTAR